MFKKEKDIDERSRTLMKNKEIRKLRSDLLLSFPKMTEAEISDLLPNKSPVTMIKFANRTLIYSVDGIPMFFDLLGRNCIYPTVYTLWRCSCCIRQIVIHSPVSQYVMRGADLMLPGLVPGQNLEGLEKGEKVSIMVRGNPSPFAVGSAEISYEYLQSYGMKGKGVAVVHIFGDELWGALGGSMVPNEGFGTSCIYGITGGGDRESSEDGEDEVDENAGGDLYSDLVSSKRESLADCAALAGMSISGPDSTQVVQLELPEAAPAVEEANIDRLLEECLMVTLKYVIKDKQLPMLASTFWSTMTKNHQPPLDIKKSKHKKVSQFLQCYQRAGILHLVETNGVLSVAKIERMHDLYKGVKNIEAGPVQLSASAVPSSAASSDQGSSFGWSKSATFTDGKIRLVSLYKFPKPAKDMFGAVRGEYGEYLKSSEVRDVVLMYIKSSDGTGRLGCAECSSDKSKVIVNRGSSFGKFLFGKKSKKKVAELTPLPASAASSSIAAGARSRDDSYSGEIPLSPVAAPRADDDEEEEEEEEECEAAGSVVAGVWMPKAPAAPSSMKGGSSIGGWGLDPGQKWKPVALPKPPQQKAGPPRPIKAAGKSIVKGDKNSTDDVDDDTDDEIVKKEEFMPLVLKRLSPYFAVIAANGEIKISSGEPPSIVIDSERRAGNKDITRVRGIEFFGLDPESVSKDWQKRFACSASVCPVPGMVKDKEIIMQGNVAFDLENYLITTAHIPRELLINKVVAKKARKR